MATGDNSIDQSIGIARDDIKSCTIRYIGRQNMTTVIATGHETTLDELQKNFPNEHIQACQEDNIQYYKTVTKEGPQFFAYRPDESIGSAYYWDNGHWHGYRTLKKAEVTIGPYIANVNSEPSISQEPADDRHQ